MQAWRRISAALRRAPVALIAAAVLTRTAPALVVWWIGRPSSVFFDMTDARQYLELGRSLAVEGTFSRLGATELSRTPLFPALLVPGLWLGWPVLTIIALHVVLGVVVTVLVYA